MIRMPDPSDTDHRRELAASLSQERGLPQPLLSVSVQYAPSTRDFFVKPGSERPFYTSVHV